MKRDYQRPEWKAFSAAIIEHDGGRCQHCRRTKRDGVTLQVHHSIYRPGVLLWQYPPSDCLTLCKGCHAKEHGKIRPSTGWSLLAHDDLGELSGECELCNTSLRYEFHIEHLKWFSMVVGKDCCDKLTGSEEASEIRIKDERRKRFLKSSRWKPNLKGIEIRQMKMDFEIRNDAAGYFIFFVKKSGPKRFRTVDQAKSFIFDFVESGDAAKYHKKHSK
jgi:hypothetical protein